MTEYRSIREPCLKKLKGAVPVLQDKFGIDAIGIFGSVARGDDTDESDINILYHFAEERGDLEEFIGMKNHLEDLFQREIDLISLDYINTRMLEGVSRDVILIYDGRKT